MSCQCAPALIRARDELSAVFPGRGRLSDGCCPSAAHTRQNPKSDHEPNAQGFARAYDFDEKIGLPGPSPLQPLIAVLLADERTKYVIYEGVLYFPDGTTRDSSGHDLHLHLSIKNDATHDTRPWGIASAFTTHEEDELMAVADDIAHIKSQVDKIRSTGIFTEQRIIDLAAAEAAERDPQAFAAALADALPDAITKDVVAAALREVLTEGVGPG